MKQTIYYQRVSSVDQNLARQEESVMPFQIDRVITDKVSGAVPLEEREGGKMLLNLVNGGQVKTIAIHDVDRLGRNLLDSLGTVEHFTKLGVNLYVKKLNLNTLKEDGTEDDQGKLFLQIIAVFAESERKRIRDRQKEGIEAAKKKGVYDIASRKRKGHSIEKFVTNPKNLTISRMIGQGKPNSTIARQLGVNYIRVIHVELLKPLGLFSKSNKTREEALEKYGKQEARAVIAGLNEIVNNSAQTTLKTA